MYTIVIILTNMQTTYLKMKPKGQLLKWVGNKFRFANEIVNYFPTDFNTYYEPFVGTGAVLATLNPEKGYAGDTLGPLIELWHEIQNNSEKVFSYYEESWEQYQTSRKETYDAIKARFNDKPNGLDLLFISRTCYGGVLRFTREGKISTPIGPHALIKPESFKMRLEEWKERVKNVKFEKIDYKELFKKAKAKDLYYCDPPYKDSQSILYGAQTFNLDELFACIKEAKDRGAYVVLSIDGIKKSGTKNIELNIPKNLFKREVFVEIGYSMLRRFQKDGECMDGEKVHERLLLTW